MNFLRGQGQRQIQVPDHKCTGRIYRSREREPHKQVPDPEGGTLRLPGPPPLPFALPECNCYVALYKDSNYRSHLETYGMWWRSSVSFNGWSNELSSVKVKSRAGGAACAVKLYDRDDYSGSSKLLKYGDHSGLGSFNDKMSSLRMYCRMCCSLRAQSCGVVLCCENTGLRRGVVEGCCSAGYCAVEPRADIWRILEPPPPPA